MNASNRSMSVCLIILIHIVLLVPLALTNRPLWTPWRAKGWNSPSQGLTADGGVFRINGRPIVIYSGSVHYFRVPKEYWYDRLRSARAAGLNTVQTYIAWNVHQEYEDSFDYSGDKDVVEFIKIAQELGLFVIVRPGPFICAEWDFGGMPAWLLDDPTMKLRSLHPRFIRASKKYLDDLLKRLSSFQYSLGGPIIAFQVENEYQSFGTDVNYILKIKEIFEGNGIVELLFSSDGENLLNRISNTPLPGILSAINFQANPENALNILGKFQPGRAKYVAEYWSGWFDHWNDKHHTMAVEYFYDVIDKILSLNASVNFYMFHGGTNFGFTNGANADITKDGLLKFSPTTTSYDYDAPLTEYGAPAAKFFAIQRLALRHRIPGGSVTSVNITRRRPLGVIQAVTFMSLTNLLDSVVQPIGELSTPNYVEYICAFIAEPCRNPYYGFVAYRRSLSDVDKETDLDISGIVADRMHVIVEGTVLGIIYTGYIAQPINYRIPVTKENVDLILLVENMGRVNHMYMNEQRKGFAGYVTRADTGVQLTRGWRVYDLGFKQDVVTEMTSPSKDHLWNPIHSSLGLRQPAFFRFNFDLNYYPTDQFLNFENWGKGVAFANARNLGRYWSVGPQKALYLPAPYLKVGKNTVLMFELDRPHQSIILQSNPNLG